MSIAGSRAEAGLKAEARGGGVIRLTLDRPARRNALSQALGEALARIAADRSARVVVLEAEGPAFRAGHDLGEMVGRPESESANLFGTCSRVMRQVRALPQPVVARVHGAAYAAGCQLVAACDLAVAADTATFATPGVRIGLFCTTPMVPIVRAIPPKAALEMLLTGEPISAERALALGLVNRVVPAAGLDEAIARLVGPILAASPEVVRIGKAAVHDLVFPDLASANLTVKAIMYTADCRFGGALRGTTRPVAFMPRADATGTRLNSPALALGLVADAVP